MIFKTEILFEEPRETGIPEQFVTVFEGEMEEWGYYPYKEIIERFKKEKPDVHILKIKTSIYEFGHKDDEWKCPQ